MRTVITLLLAGGLAQAGVKSGHAEFELLCGSTGYLPGTPVQLGLELVLDEGWHTYWTNPGEGGMQPQLKWDLPEGWLAGPVLFPVPERFLTGILPGYGYGERVILPVYVTPSEDATGAAEIGVSVDWLTCNDEACVPGSAQGRISLDPEAGEPTSAADDIADFLARVPQPLDGAALAAELVEGDIRLAITLPEGVDASGAELLPATPGVFDHAKEWRLPAGAGNWTLSVPLNEYASELPEAVEVVLVGGGLAQPLLLSSGEPE